jgi:hypothetical protein
MDERVPRGRFPEMAPDREGGSPAGNPHLVKYSVGTVTILTAGCRVFVCFTRYLTLRSPGVDSLQPLHVTSVESVD